jgi:hypothetical protein
VVVALSTSFPSTGGTCGSPLYSIETASFDGYKKTWNGVLTLLGV